MNTTLSPEAVTYLEAVRDRLQGMPADETDELVSDLEQHLAELVAEEPGPLSHRLGSPQEYAAELAASAGWTDQPETRTVSVTSTISEWKQRLAATSPLIWWSRHWPEYRPGWWVVRALLVVVLWAALYWSGPNMVDWLWTIPAVGLSVIAGRRSGQARRWLLVDRVATIFAFWAVVAALANGLAVMSQSVIYTYYDYNPNGLVGPNGIVESIYAYDREGQPTDVFLYDQNGSPLITNWNQYSYEVSGGDQPIGNFYPTERVIDGQVVPRPAVQVPGLPED